MGGLARQDKAPVAIGAVHLAVGSQFQEDLGMAKGAADAVAGDLVRGDIDDFRLGSLRDWDDGSRGFGLGWGFTGHAFSPAGSLATRPRRLRYATIAFRVNRAAFIPACFG
jgi:hypothetical protein